MGAVLTGAAYSIFLRKNIFFFFRTCCTLSGGLQFVECEAFYFFIWEKSGAWIHAPFFQFSVIIA